MTTAELIEEALKHHAKDIRCELTPEEQEYVRNMAHGIWNQPPLWFSSDYKDAN